MTQPRAKLVVGPLEPHAPPGFRAQLEARLAVRGIDPEEETQRIARMMAEADERTPEVLERYGGLHPVTFGQCGYPGLCVRGTARSFCLGCPFLVRRPEYIDRVDFLLEGYLTAADAHERMGDLDVRPTSRFLAQDAVGRTSCD